MIDPRKIVPLLTDMTVEHELGRGPSGIVYLVSRRLDQKKLALKHVAIPSSDTQTRALIYSGAVRNEAEAQAKYARLVQDIKNELLLLNSIKNAPNLLKFRGYQVDQKFVGVGYDVYMLSDYCKPLPEYLSAHPLTKLQAANLALDLASALEQLRSADLIHKDVRPSNIHLGDNRHFLLGDLGAARISDLKYSSMPEELITEYTAPEVQGDDATLSETMDIYAAGMILYEIYNGGLLPMGEDGRFARTEEELPAPQYADQAMGEIILKATAFQPDDRYQSPTEMKQALTLYMQRTSISGDPLVPPPPPADDDATVDVAAIAATVAAGQAAEAGLPLEQEPEVPALEADPGFILDSDAEKQEEEPAEPKVTLSDLGDDELLLPPQKEISVDDFLASIRKTPGLEVLSMDKSGNTEILPGYETEETLPEDTEFVDSADNHAPMPDYDAGEEAPAEELPEVPKITLDVPEAEEAEPEEDPEEVPAEDPVAEEEPAEEAEEADAEEELPEEEPEEAYDEDAEEEEAEAEEADEAEPQPKPVPTAAQRRRIRRHAEEEESEEDDEEYDDGYEEDEDDDQPSGTWKKALIAVIVLLVLAGGAFGLYTFKTDTVNKVSSQVLSSSSIQISAETKKSTAMEVVCSTSTGEVARMPLTSEGATFTGLNPSTSYTFELASTDGMFLLGSKRTQASTIQMTTLTGFGASSVSAVSAKLVLQGTGTQPDTWVVTATAPDGSTVTAESDTFEIEVTGLSPDTTYNATIARGDGDNLGGTTTCSFKTMGYTELGSFAATKVDMESATLSWDFTGTVPDTWTVTCTGTDGSSTSQEVSGTECTLNGLTSGVTYTMALSTPSLKATEASTIHVTIPSLKISEISSIQNDDGNIEVTWTATGDTKPEEWSISYVYASDSEVTPTLLTSKTTSVVLENPIPNAEYTFQVVGADGLTVGDSPETKIVTSEADAFTKYGCSDAEMSLYVLEDNPDSLEESSDTFRTTEHLAFAIQVNYDASDEDKTVKTMYVIRNSAGNPIYVYRNDDPGRTWSGSWTTARHTGDLPDMPQRPGTYTLEVYFDGDLLADAEFTVTEE